MTTASMELLFNGKTTGAVQIPATYNMFFFPQDLSIVAVQVSAKTSSPTVSIGTNSPNFDNILAATSLSGLAARGDFINFDLLSPTVLKAINTTTTPIFVNVSVAANATTFNLALELRGEYHVV